MSVDWEDVSHIELRNVSSRQLEMIRQKCKNLRSLTLLVGNGTYNSSYGNLRSENIAMVLRRFNCLERLSVEVFHYQDDVMGYIVPTVVENNKCLRSLRLSKP